MNHARNLTDVLTVIYPSAVVMETSSEPHNSSPVEAKFANSLGVLIVTFGLVVFGILSKNKWQQPEARR